MGCLFSKPTEDRRSNDDKVIAIIESTGDKIYPSKNKIKIGTISNPSKWTKVSYQEDRFLLTCIHDHNTYRIEPDGDWLKLLIDVVDKENGLFTFEDSDSTGKRVLKHVKTGKYVRLETKGGREKLYIDVEKDAIVIILK